VASVFVASIVVISSRRASNTGHVRLRAWASTNSGNHPATRTAQPARSVPCPSPATIPAASVAATYLRTVFTSTPRLTATTVFGRPACQCANTSTTSITWNCLLAIRPALASKKRPRAGAYKDSGPHPGHDTPRPSGPSSWTAPR